MTWDTVIGVVFPVLTAIVGGFCILLYGGQATLRATNGDQEKRILLLEAQTARDEEIIAKQTAEISVLQKVVTGEVQLLAIEDLLDFHHKQSTEAWEIVHAATASILKALGERSL